MPSVGKEFANVAQPHHASPVPVPIGILVVAVGGALGAVARGALLEHWPAGSGTFPWTVFAINVSGSMLLALLPAIGLVRRVAWLPLFLGTGVIGGYTTMSTAAVETYDLRHHAAVAVAYVFGTLAAAIGGVLLVDRLSTPAERALIAAEEGDE
ncbi:MAG: FluC/FEX family fluoride channel [Marmoricola sp.]